MLGNIGVADINTATACGCIGPQNGEPRCPCQMKNITEVNGRWVEVIDHGPAIHSDGSDRIYNSIGVNGK